MAPVRKPMKQRPGFDVTCVVGRVEFSEDGSGDLPHVAAFKLIAEHGSDGVYVFPGETGDRISVTVETGGEWA